VQGSRKPGLRTLKACPMSLAFSVVRDLRVLIAETKGRLIYFSCSSGLIDAVRGRNLIELNKNSTPSRPSQALC
jgi:hypothetical protein